MSIVPFMRTPFTDMGAPTYIFQGHPECSHHEMHVVDCLEAYGVHAGRVKCRLLLEDFRECVIKSKQKARVNIMEMERQRQYNAGERKKLYAEDVAVDSY